MRAVSVQLRPTRRGLPLKKWLKRMCGTVGMGLIWTTESYSTGAPWSNTA